MTAILAQVSHHTSFSIYRSLLGRPCIPLQVEERERGWRVPPRLALSLWSPWTCIWNCCLSSIESPSSCSTPAQVCQQGLQTDRPPPSQNAFLSQDIILYFIIIETYTKPNLYPSLLKSYCCAHHLKSAILTSPRPIHSVCCVVYLPLAELQQHAGDSRRSMRPPGGVEIPETMANRARGGETEHWPMALHSILYMAAWGSQLWHKQLCISSWYCA